MEKQAIKDAWMSLNCIVRPPQIGLRKHVFRQKIMILNTLLFCKKTKVEKWVHGCSCEIGPNEIMEKARIYNKDRCSKEQKTA
jgi:hypothetical protein